MHLHRIDWHGMAILIRQTPGRFCPAFDHLEITSEKPENAALPITETGYRSHFMRSEELDAFGGPVAFVLAWLNAEAKSDKWESYVAQSRQLCLF